MVKDKPQPLRRISRKGLSDPKMASSEYKKASIEAGLQNDVVAVTLLHKLRDDVTSLDSRLHSMATNMDSKELQDKLKVMEKEKGETEQVLTRLRSKLEKERLRQSKRQRLKARMEAGTMDNKSVSNSSRSAMNSLNRNMQIRDDKENSDNAADEASLREMSDKEVEELDVKIKALETQKNELENTLLELLHAYEDKTSVLQSEKERLADDNETTYNEMKTLLIQQHEESERLRNQVAHLEVKRKSSNCAFRTFVLLFILTLTGISLWIASLLHEDVSMRTGALNYACAPVRPGGQMTASSGRMEAPWWAPPYTKELFFSLVCEDRPRVRLEIKRGVLWMTQQPDHTTITKTFGSKARIEAERIHVYDKGGGYKVFEAPWNKSPPQEFL